MEERTGKSLTALLVAEALDINSVLVITKKKALDSWTNLLKVYDNGKKCRAINYHQAWKETARPDLVILDESHNYLSAYPKIGATAAQLSVMRKANKPNKNIYDAVKKLCKNKPIIYVSATPYAQGPQMLYHQLSLSAWSPWRHYSNFYNWFRMYGEPYTIKLKNREVTQYDKVKTDMVVAMAEHLLITKTRQELGFEYEPKDSLHYIGLADTTKHIYNELVEDEMVFLPELEEPLVCDTTTKLRFALHMLEGGVAKVDEISNGKITPMYYVLSNTEKVDYILEMWGDTKDLVIMYNYKAEKLKLYNHFKQATILQATSYAEGVDLSGYSTLVIYSQDFSTARHTQRRARQCNMKRDESITVHYLLVKKGLSEQVYKTVSINKKNFVDSVYDKETL